MILQGVFTEVLKCTELERVLSLAVRTAHIIPWVLGFDFSRSDPSWLLMKTLEVEQLGPSIHGETWVEFPASSFDPAQSWSW